MSYIVKNGSLMAKINAELTSGTEIRYATQRVAEQINAAREFNLVNSHSAKIGNGAKWDKKWAKVEGDDFVFGVEINPGEFFIS